LIPSFYIFRTFRKIWGTERSMLSRKAEHDLVELGEAGAFSERRGKGVKDPEGMASALSR
jgi:hypothetical protein